MGLDTAQEIRWLRSRPASAGFAPEKVDAENGILRDVVMVEEGEAKGHGVWLDEDFIRDITEYDLRHFSNRGLKARFGHPSASSETMGTQMGFFKNFRTRRSNGKLQSIADLHLLESADESPTHPGMRSWMLKMAAERPDFVMMSIVFRASGYFQKKANGHKVYIGSEWDANPDLGEVFVEFGDKGEHFYTDAVEAGAATESLFATKMNPDFFVSRAHQWLDDNPDILDFVKANPQRVQFFLHRLGISIQPQPQQKKMSKFSIWKWLNGESQDGEPTTDDLEALQAQLAEAKQAFAAIKTEKEALENRVKEFESQVASLQANVAQLKTEAEALKADAAAKAAEIERLKAEPAALHTGAETEPAPAKSERAYEKNPLYQKAKTFRRPQVTEGQ